MSNARLHIVPNNLPKIVADRLWANVYRSPLSGRGGMQHWWRMALRELDKRRKEVEKVEIARAKNKKVQP